MSIKQWLWERFTRAGRAHLVRERDMTGLAAKRALCAFVGHRVDVHGLTGKYDWCSRCYERFDADG